HLNQKKVDGFLETLLSKRPDLNGLPFVMGDACRTKGEQSRQFGLAVALVRQALQGSAVAITRVEGSGAVLLADLVVREKFVPVSTTSAPAVSQPPAAPTPTGPGAPPPAPAPQPPTDKEKVTTAPPPVIPPPAPAQVKG